MKKEPSLAERVNKEPSLDVGHAQKASQRYRKMNLPYQQPERQCQSGLESCASK